MRKILALVIVSIIVIACGNDGLVVMEENEAQLDQKIVAAINGTGSSIEDYIMPESDDYRNIPQDPKNHLTRSKVELGKLLFMKLP